MADNAKLNISYKKALPESKWEGMEEFLGFLITMQNKFGRYKIQEAFNAYYKHKHGCLPISNKRPNKPNPEWAIKMAATKAAKETARIEKMLAKKERRVVG